MILIFVKQAENKLLTSSLYKLSENHTFNVIESTELPYNGEIWRMSHLNVIGGF